MSNVGSEKTFYCRVYVVLQPLIRTFFIVKLFHLITLSPIPEKKTRVIFELKKIVVEKRCVKTEQNEAIA